MINSTRWLSLGVGYVTTYAAGTERYVHRLNSALLHRGIEAHACFYADGDVPLSVDGVRCHRLERPADQRSRRERFAQRPLGLDGFERLLRELRPSIVHVNAFGAAASVEHLRAARDQGAKVVATYHSPGFSCPSHALLYRRRTLCDGELRVSRCTRCCLTLAGLPLPIAAVLGAIDLTSLTRIVPANALHPFERRGGTAEYIARWRTWMENCDIVTYAADWVRDVLLGNHVTPSKLLHLPLPPPLVTDVEPKPDFWNWARPGAFRLLYAGRVVDTKGTHILIDALRLHLKGENVALCILGALETSDYGRTIERAVAMDDRVRWYPPEPEVLALGAQRACDAVVVPSLWPETGPYSVLEAQWVGATIIGSDRAGIAQLLRGYGRGFLFAPGDPRSLADAIRLAMRQPPPKESLDRDRYTAAFDRCLDELLGRVC